MLFNRTESKDFVFGSTRLMVAPPAVQWEVEDKVEYHADEEVWQPATVIAVYPDQRYSIKLDDSNTVKIVSTPVLCGCPLSL